MKRLDRFLYQKEKPLWERALLFPLYLLSVPYGWAVRARLRLYDLGLLRPRRLPCPVISVGNITLGGTGKTPLTMALAEGLQDRGIKVAVLSRGYKRRKPSGPIVTDGHSVFLSPEESGDEPFLMSATLKGVPVLVGKDRFANGELALQRFKANGFILDDGYQHLQLHRDLNILLIDATIGFGDRHLFPRGLLREPVTHLRRAHLILLTKLEDSEVSHPLEEELRSIQPSLPLFHSYYQPSGLVGPRGERQDLALFRDRKVLAFSGIANPAYFTALLKKCGMEVIKEESFPDHHRYTAKDLEWILARSKGADWIVTTQKDMVKLAHLNIDSLPIRALHVGMKIREEKDFFERVMALFSVETQRRVRGTQ